MTTDLLPEEQPIPSFGMTAAESELEEKRFAAAFVRLKSAAGAARELGYTGQNAQLIGSRLAHSPAVREEMFKVAKQALAREQMTAEEVLSGLAHIARGDVTNLLEWDALGFGRFKASAKLTPAQSATIREIGFDPDTGKISRVKLHDALKAREMLGRALGVLEGETKTIRVQGVGDAPLDMLRAIAAGEADIIEGDFEVIEHDTSKRDGG